jgi:hypothetical protein
MDIISASDWAVFLIVVGLRFLLPLLIPFVPLPAIIACLLLDGVDQTIFQTFTNLPLGGYQSYDKALDIYYLTVAYISTFRNWTNASAFQMSRFLYYYRLVGVVLFESTQWRPLLLIFPNTFEYFFIWYEAVRLLWDPKKLSRRAVIIAAAAIWIVIKLPQEYWIHIAQRDATDTIKELLGGTPESAWGPLITGNLLIILVVLGAIAGAVYLLYRFLQRRLPKPDHGLAWRADDYTERPSTEAFAAAYRVWRERIFDRDLFEKVVLVSLLTIIFSNVLPTSHVSATRIIINVATFVTLNTVFSHVAARRGQSFYSGVAHFLMILALNFGIVFVLGLVLGGRTNWFNATFFVLLLSLIVTLYDRFQTFHLARFPRGPLFARR